MEVHLCPAVPTAPKTAPMIDILRSAFSVMMMALFPPNSRIDFPKRSATFFPTILPTLVEPVKETKAALMRCEAGFSTKTKEASEINGTDFDTNVDRGKSEREKLAKIDGMYQLAISRELNEVFSEAEKISNSMNDKFITEEHLFMSLINKSDSKTIDILKTF